MHLVDRCVTNFISVISIYLVLFQAQKKNFNGPTLGPKMADSNVREFTEEQRRAGQNLVGLLNDGMNKGASQAGQNFGLSRHI